MNDELMFEYLMQMGAMRPEQEELKRKQAMVVIKPLPLMIATYKRY